MTMLRLAAALAAVLTPGLPASAALPDADPAIWVVRDQDTTIYLFGTFHALDGQTDWFNDEVKSAFDGSDEIVLEVLPPDDPRDLQPIVARYAIDTSGKALSDKLKPASREKLRKQLADMGAPADAFDKLKPFFASMTLVLAQSQKLGLTGEKGAEAVLTAAAKTAGKPLGNLETAEFQIALFDQLPEAKQLAMLESTLDQLDKFPALFARMANAWNSGNAEEFTAILREMEAQSPEAFKLLLSDRNATWAKWIDERLDRPGTVFLAVGTGHLAGTDSVQDFLRQRGLTAERVPAN